MHDLLETVWHTIRRYRMFRSGDRVGVGVSGGADSVALLLILEELRAKLGIALTVVHFNHGLRGRESDADERFVAELAKRHGLVFRAERADVAAQARQHRWNLEDAGRRLRYAFFEEVIRSGDADRIAVGHTADDQAETVLSRILRGTGPAGLAGIYPVKGHVVRPLLDVRRDALRRFLSEKKQVWREDSSNEDVGRLRARIRHELLPRLESEWQRAVVRHLTNLAEVCRAEEAYWNEWTAQYVKGAASVADGGISIPVTKLLTFESRDSGNQGPLESEGDLALARRTVRKLAEICHGGALQIHAEHVELVLHLARSGSSGQRVELPGGVRVARMFDRLIFEGPANGPAPAREETEVAGGSYEYSVTPRENEGLSLELSTGRKRLSFKVIDWSRTPRDTREARNILDLDSLRPPLVIRNWRPGDAYRPVGRREPRKLKEMFLEHRIPAPERRGWPVLTSAGQVVWALGMPVAAECAVRETSRSALRIIEEPA